MEPTRSPKELSWMKFQRLIRKLLSVEKIGEREREDDSRDGMEYSRLVTFDIGFILDFPSPHDAGAAMSLILAALREKKQQQQSSN